MTEMDTGAVEPLKVHLAGSDIPIVHQQPGKVRHGASLRTFTFTASDPVQQILPLHKNRCEANLQAFTNDVTVYTSRADAQAGGGGGVTIPATNTVPYPLNTTDEVWATAAVLPTRLSVSAIIEGD